MPMPERGFGLGETCRMISALLLSGLVPIQTLHLMKRIPVSFALTSGLESMFLPPWVDRGFCETFSSMANTFWDSHSVDKEPFVGNCMVGAGLVFSRFKMSFAHVHQTKKFKTQKNEYSFTAITLSFSY